MSESSAPLKQSDAAPRTQLAAAAAEPAVRFAHRGDFSLALARELGASWRGRLLAKRRELGAECAQKAQRTKAANLKKSLSRELAHCAEPAFGEAEAALARKALSGYFKFFRSA